MYNKFDARFIDFNPFLFHNIFHFLISTNSKGTKRKKRKGKKTEGESWIGFKSVGIKLIRSPGFRCINVEWNSILGGASIYRYPTQPLCYPFFFFRLRTAAIQLRPKSRSEFRYPDASSIYFLSWHEGQVKIN